MNLNAFGRSNAVLAQRMPLWLGFGLLAGVAQLARILSGWQFDLTLRRVLTGFVIISLGLLVAWALRQAARRPDFPPRLRSGLNYIAAGAVMNALGTLYIYCEAFLVPESHARFSVGDVFFLSVYPLTLLGLARLPRSDRPVAGLGRILLDGTVFVVGIGVPLWLFAVHPSWQASAGIDALMIVLWPLFAFCGVLAVNAALLTCAPLPTRGTLWLLLMGLGVSWLGDLLFTLDATTHFLSRNLTSATNATTIGSFCLCLYAAWRCQVDPMPASRSVEPAASSPVPMMAILTVTGWLALLAASGKVSPVSFSHLLVGFILLFLVLFAREILIWRDGLRWMAASAQRESQARFESMVKNSSDLIMILGESHRVRFASPSATTVLGTTSENLLGRDLLELVHPDDLTAGTRLLDELRQQSRSVLNLRWRLRNADGSYRQIETVGSNLLGETAIAGLVLNSRDITERLALEERLHRAEKMAAIGNLAGGVAHDFNNLLAVIVGNCELALMGLSASHTSRRDIEEVLRATSRGTTLTSRLLSFNRSENLQPRVVAPAEVLASIISVLQRNIGPGLKLVTRMESPDGLVKINPAALEQALLNLVSNARDASTVGDTLTVTIRMQVLAAPLDTPYLSVPAGSYIVVEVADIGTGMSDTTRARLFEPFFTTKERGRGTGLGLAAVYGMVKAAEGGLTVKSEPGKGTTIGIWLPQAPRKTIATASRPAAPAASVSETILLVEDEDMVRVATQRILLAKGYQVLVACDAAEAHRVLESHAGKIDLLLTDVMMPGQSGPALAADLVRKQPDLRVLYMSGYTGDELEAHGLAGADAQLLVKPFSVADLTARLREILAG